MKYFRALFDLFKIFNVARTMIYFPLSQSGDFLKIRALLFSFQKRAGDTPLSWSPQPFSCKLLIVLTSSVPVKSFVICKLICFSNVSIVKNFNSGNYCSAICTEFPVNVFHPLRGSLLDLVERHSLLSLILSWKIYMSFFCVLTVVPLSKYIIALPSLSFPFWNFHYIQEAYLQHSQFVHHCHHLHRHLWNQNHHHHHHHHHECYYYHHRHHHNSFTLVIIIISMITIININITFIINTAIITITIIIMCFITTINFTLTITAINFTPHHVHPQHHNHHDHYCQPQSLHHRHYYIHYH